MMRSFVKLALGVFGAFGVLPGQQREGIKFEGRSREIVCEVFSLPLLEAVELKRAGKSDKEDYTELVKRVEAGTARQEKFLMTRVTKGEVTASEEIVEVSYASSYDPPEMPNKVGKLPENLEAVRQVVTPSGPTAFDTRKVGTLLEVKVSDESERVVGVSARLELVDLLGRQAFGRGPGEIEMPRFSARSLSADLRMKLEVPVLLGSISPPKERRQKAGERRVWLAFLTVSVAKN